MKPILQTIKPNDMKAMIATISLIANSILAMAQISLENTYMYSASVSEISDNEYSYFLMDVPQQQCRLYTTNHTLYKTINLPVPQDYYASDIKFVTKHLFNADDKIELLCIYEKYVTTESGYYVQYALSVLNEDGDQLLNLPNGGWAEINQVESATKLLAYSYVYNPAGYYDVITSVYGLGGSSSVINSVNQQEGLVFPNPASDYIMIDTQSLPQINDGEFSLFTIAGQKILTRPINSGQNFSLPVNKLSAGSYIYTIKSKNNLIQSNTIIIK